MEDNNIPTCPYCESTEIEERPYKAAVGASVTGKYPAEEDYIAYKCITCGQKFDETEM